MGTIMKRYKINLSKQIEYLESHGFIKPNTSPKSLSFGVSIKKDKRVRKGKRDVLVIAFKPKKADRYYQVNVNGSIEVPKEIIQRITNTADGEKQFSMISPVDDGGQKIIVPWLDSQGQF